MTSTLASSPDLVAKEYAVGGASCLSVLTDGQYFGGSVDDLHGAARAACDLPVLRKDFTVSELDVVDARLMGADAVLLIAAALSDGELRRFHQRATALGLAALVEVHDEAELERALEPPGHAWSGSISGTCAPSPSTGPGRPLAARIPADVVAVAESGIRDGDDARRLADAGYDAILVGETLVRAGDRAAALRALVGHPVAAR